MGGKGGVGGGRGRGGEGEKGEGFRSFCDVFCGGYDSYRDQRDIVYGGNVWKSVKRFYEFDF